MQLSLQGKVALVTGGSRGIGFAIASAFAEAGAAVMLTSRKAEDLENAAVEISSCTGGAVSWYRADVGETADAVDCVAATVAQFGSIDVLVNNAGTNPNRLPLVDMDEALAERTVQVNQLAVVRWTTAAWRAGMREHGGAVLNIAAIGGMDVYQNAGWYGGTKAAIIQMTRQMAYELGPAVRVNTIAPGVVRTGFGKAQVDEYGDVLPILAQQPAAPSDLAAHLPLRRLGEPEDIANAALFLVSDAASWITGQTLAVDGGHLTMPRGAP